ncbi:MAG: ZIP family metal transporter [Candidatus Omnitrophica bacterium]|nr:ZIP family metal transporter [Candidatus Omnitrophota bacterium]
MLTLFNHPWFLGLLAGGTIVFGLPIAKLRAVSPKTKGFLNALSTGILIFLLVEIAGHLIEEVEELVEGAVVTGGSMDSALRYGGLFVLGFSVGLLALVWFEQRFIGRAKDEQAPGKRAKQLALMIAIGLGLHNLSEGLAIGQGHAAGAVQLALLLAIGFALHNATEGFGIAAPLSGHKVSWGFLGLCALIAGGPTYVGAVAGSAWVSKPAEIFCLALAAGSILYIIGELLHLGRLLKGEVVVSVGLLLGFFLAMATDFVLAAGLEITSGHAPRHGGLFGDANDLYHYEVVRPAGGGQVLLYVNDHQNRPMDTRTLTGRWVLDPDSAKPLTGPFVSSENGAYLVASLPEQTKRSAAHLKVEVLKGSDWAPMEFYLPISSQE